MSPHADQKYIKALCNNDAALINEIYDKCATNCEQFVKKNSGSEIEAADVFQEAIIEVYLKCKDLILTVPICAYIGIIYKRKWYNKLNRQKKFVRILKDIGYIHSTVDFPDIKLREEKMELIFKASFSKLDKKCKNVLNMYSEGRTGKEIGEMLNIDRNNVYKQKHDCLDRLKTYCEQHPHFIDIKQ